MKLPIVKFQSNVNVATRTTKLGVLNALLGDKGSVELWSNSNFEKDEVRLLIRAFNSSEEEFKLLCTQQMSDAIRGASSQAEYTQLMNQLLTTNVVGEWTPRRNRRGEILFDDKDEPILDLALYLGEEYVADNMSATKIKSDTKLKATPKVATKFDWEKRAF